MAASGSTRKFVCAVLLLAAAGGAQAGVIRVDFSGVVRVTGTPFAGPAGSPYSAHYTYDSAASPVPLPAGFLGSGYRGISFVIDNTPVNAEVVIGISRNRPSYGVDVHWVLTEPSGFPGMQLVGPPNLFTSEGLSELDLVVFSDFTYPDSNGVYTSQTVRSADITSWSQRSVSEPGTLAVLGLGIASLALSRRRRMVQPES